MLLAGGRSAGLDQNPSGLAHTAACSAAELASCPLESMLQTPVVELVCAVAVLLPQGAIYEACLVEVPVKPSGGAAVDDPEGGCANHALEPVLRIQLGSPAVAILIFPVSSDAAAAFAAPATEHAQAQSDG